MEDPEVKVPDAFKTGDSGSLSKGVDNQPMQIPDPQKDTIDRTQQVIKDPHPSIGKAIDLPPQKTNSTNFKKASILTAALAGVVGLIGVITHRGVDHNVSEQPAATAAGDKMIQDRNNLVDIKASERPLPVNGLKK